MTPLSRNLFCKHSRTGLREICGEERDIRGADIRKMTQAERRDRMKRMAEKSGYGV